MCYAEMYFIFILRSDVWVEYFWLENKLNCFYNFDKSHMAVIARVHFWIFCSFVLWICPSHQYYLDCCNYMVNCQVSLTLFFLIVLAILFPFHIKNVSWILVIITLHLYVSFEENLRSSFISSVHEHSIFLCLVFYFLLQHFVVSSIQIIHIFVDLYLSLTSSCKWLLCFKFCL